MSRGQRPGMGRSPVARATATLIARRHLLGLTGGAILALGGAAATTGAEDQPPTPEMQAALLFEQINGYRQSLGLPALVRSGRLDASALAHATDMAQHNLVAHVSSDGTDPFDRIARYYPYPTWLGENVAAGFDGAAAVLAAWQASGGHNENLVQPEFRAIGLALAVNPEAAYYWFWTVDFGGQPDEG